MTNTVNTNSVLKEKFPPDRYVKFNCVLLHEQAEHIYQLSMFKTTYFVSRVNKLKWGIATYKVAGTRWRGIRAGKLRLAAASDCLFYPAINLHRHRPVKDVCVWGEMSDHAVKSVVTSIYHEVVQHWMRCRAWTNTMACTQFSKT